MNDKTKYRVSNIVTREFEQYANVPDGYIERTMAAKIINDMPIEDLRKLFLFEKISFSDEMEPSNPDWLNAKIWDLKRTQTTECIATIEI